ncbi:MAG: mannose-6-phosphate isomerase, class I [Elusimicrobia bacterium]|nr:mannose-6-phosphate isomerase, class I [Elusimicrobiota bacterium]
MVEKDGVVVLSPGVQHYEWGGSSVIADLLDRSNTDGRPFAELWMGAHPGNPSKVARASGDSVGLDELIARDPEGLLGRETAAHYGGLPFLFKVLDAAKPLSIQVHPGLEQARAGFADEDARGVPRQAPSRNYKDANHKPELVVAFGIDFWALRGFRPYSQITELLGAHPELHKLAREFVPTAEGLKRLYGSFMTDRTENVEALLRPLLDRWRRENQKAPFPKEDPRYWVLRADAQFSSPGRTDRGLLSVLLLNLVKLKPGEALYLPAGVLHAYLEGTAMEIMANSDNVLRGGLTPKHVDVPELLKTVVFEGALPEVLSPRAVRGAESVYRTGAAEFELRRLDLRAGIVTAEVPHPALSQEEREKQPFPLCGMFHTTSPSWSGEIYLVASGSVDVRWNVSGKMNVETGKKKGFCFFVPRGCVCSFKAGSDALVFKAGVPPVRSFRGKQPTELAFGTSGLRGLIRDITDLEAYVNTRGFLRYLVDQKGTVPGDVITMGLDLRPSTPRIASAVARAVSDEGLSVENTGCLPSPALLSYALGQNRPSVMVTGSHIPFDRNGIKFNLKSGEVLKEDEQGILARVQEVRAEEYNRPAQESLFDDSGFLASAQARSLPMETPSARDAYVRRYLNFFSSKGLSGCKVAVYQHSAVGRDLVVDILRGLGAQVTALGRSEEFVPIDTEDISDERLRDLQKMADQARQEMGALDALVSTDGDSDRPLVCGVRPDGGLVFLPGDLLGPLVAEYLEADAVVAPISANDALDIFLKGRRCPPTRIGSPYVVAAMKDATSNGFRRVVGYEANGGFLLQSPLEKQGRRLAPLPTRDAVLPILCVLFSAREKGLSLVALFDRLPRRFSKAGLLDNFPVESSRAILKSFSSPNPRVIDVVFGGKEEVTARDVAGQPVALSVPDRATLLAHRRRLEGLFNSAAGFEGGLCGMNVLDGIRLRFGNGDVAHVRPSGNAPQLRIYACAGTPQRAHDIVRLGLREPDGLLWTLETVR